jgi:hypothetical protein
MNLSYNHHPKKPPIIPLTNTVINPCTMMIKALHTAITNSTMLAIIITVTLTKLTIAESGEIRSEGLVPMLAPFVAVDDSISRVAAGGDG